LSDNEISSEGAIYLLKALESNKTVKSLFLQGNPITDDIFDALESLINSSKSIELIDLRDTGLSGDKRATALKLRAADRGITLYI
ncbi:hypothetical protein DID80_07900, partial [Candidatus Marinamargulisbacteria bacterium SCGC AAA071-K20]